MAIASSLLQTLLWNVATLRFAAIKLVIVLAWFCGVNVTL